MMTDWKLELAESACFILILDEDFYQSARGEEILHEAIRLRKPIVLLAFKDRNTAIPDAYERYQGFKTTLILPSSSPHDFECAAPLIEQAFQDLGFEAPVEIFSRRYDMEAG